MIKLLLELLASIIIFLGYISLYHFFDPVAVITYTVYTFMAAMFVITVLGSIVADIDG